MRSRTKTVGDTSAAPSDPEVGGDLPFLSVLLPCRNEEAHIADCLRSILAGDYPNDLMEILVIDGESTDTTPDIVREIARDHPEIELLRNSAGITPAGLNAGIRRAKGSVIARVDGHARLPTDYFRQLVRALRDYGADCVGGVCEIRPSRWSAYGAALARALNHRFGVGNSPFRVGAPEVCEADTALFGCWPRDLFDRVGVFDESLVRSQDMDFSSRIRANGGRIFLLPHVRCTYYARPGFVENWHYNFGNGYWVTYPWITRGTRFSWRHFVPGLFVGVLAIGLALSPTRVGRRLLWAALGAYLSANLAASASLLDTDSPGASMLTPVAFASLHVSYGVGSLAGVVRALMEGADS
jgi:glycosyltransferase involved in cell wall biosynthesis